MDYSFFGHFFSYVQMMAALDLALVFIDKGSLVIKLQTKILEAIKESLKPVLNEAGKVTQVCRKDTYSKTESGRLLLAKADIIRGHKKAFEVETEAERLSAFMPAIGLTSGLFCIIYLLLIPYLLKTGDVAYLYFLEYFAEATSVSQCIVLLTLFMKDIYGYLSSLFLATIWLILPMFIATILYVLGFTIECFGIELYLFLFILLPATPILIMIFRIAVLACKRYSRAKVIKRKTIELRNALKL